MNQAKLYHILLYNIAMTPIVRIKNAWLLHENASVHLHKLWGDDSMLADYKKVDEIVHEYTEAWRPYEHQILEAMTDILQLEFRQNIIDVYIAPWFWAFSEPMVIGVVHKPDRFVDILTHELLHRLLTDNTSIASDKNMVPVWRKLFESDLPFKTIVHIPVHAVHTAIYLDYLKEPQRLQRDKAADKKHAAEDYVRSWEYVAQHGYKDIIKQLEKSYRSLVSGI